MNSLKSLRRFLLIPTLGLALSAFVPKATAALLVYEPFDLAPGQSLDGLSGGANAVGMIGVWRVGGNGTAPFTTTNGVQVIAPNLNPGPLWKGVCTSVPQKGVYAGSAATPGFGGMNGNNPNHMWASRPLDPNVVTNFTLGSTTWMSCVQSQNFNVNNNYIAMTFCLGAGIQNGLGGGGDPAPGRGTGVQGGPAVGLGVASGAWGAASPKYFIAGVWDTLGGDGVTYIEQNHTGNTGIQVVVPGQIPPVWINIVKIVWGDLNTPTTVTMACFRDGAALSEAAFDQFTSTNLQTASTMNMFVDPMTFTNISLGGGRWNCDELRIGTTFDDVIGLVPGAPGVYWAPTGQGGSGTWAAGLNNWASIPNIVGALPPSATDTLFFAGTGGTVTVDGTVTAGAGIQFSVDGYQIVPGAATPQLNLAGADPDDNTITVNAGESAIGVQITGAAGLTKAGLATLVLNNTANAYSGGTVLKAGTLRFAALGTFGSGNLTFEGGAVAYPSGSGPSLLDLSARINPVASGHAAMIDTGGSDVTFATGLSGDGGLTKLGSGSLTLAAANTYAGPTTVSGGTLFVNGNSGFIATLNVPAGGTVNLGAGAMIGALNITGGTVSLAGPGVQVGTLFVSSGAFNNPANHALSVTNSANLVGVLLSLNGASAFTLSGTDLLNPTSTAQRVVSANGGTLGFLIQGLDVAIGQGSPGIPASPATARFLGNGMWDLVNGVATDINNVYGKDNHAFHYIQLPLGDFDIQCRVTGVTNATAGLMARDNLVSSWDSGRGNYIGIYTALGNAVTGVYANNQSAASRSTPPWINSANFAQGMVTPYLQIKRVGNTLTTFCSNDGVNYLQVQEVDFASSPWGPTMYLGIDLINTATGGGSAAFDEVNFMGTAGTADLGTTEFRLSGGAKMDLGPVMYVSAISTNGVALAEGCWAGSPMAGATWVDPNVFTSTGPGIAVISGAEPFTVTAPDLIVTGNDPFSVVPVTYPPPTLVGGTLPYTATNYVPPSGSLFYFGTNWVSCTVTDSACPAGRNAYASFRVIVLPPAPVLNPAVDPNTGLGLPGGVPTITFGTVAWFRYRVLYSASVDQPLSAWSPLVNETTDPQGWLFAVGPYTTLADPGGVGVQRFYAVEVIGP